MAAMKRGLPRLVFAPLNRPTPIALNLEPEPEPAARRRLPFSHQTRSEQYLADKTILGRNKSQIAPSLPLLLFANKGRPPLSAKSSFAPRGLGKEGGREEGRELEVLVRGQQTSPPTRMVGRRRRRKE